MSSILHVPDISEYQANVDFAKIGPAVILRAYNGRRADRTFAARQPLARAHQKARGFYIYLVKDRDAATQATEAAGVIGKLEHGEAIFVDIEEGDGDQAPRFAAAYKVLKARCGGKVGLYSGRAFYAAHLARAHPDLLWLAAYGPNEPSTPHLLWQHTDAETHPGIGSCDCSIFHGTVDQLVARLSPSTPTPTPVKPTEARMIVRFAGHPDVYEVVGSHLEHITAAAYAARGNPAVHDLPANHPLNSLPKTSGAA
jgi:GH25 family lysozyme M1 (1,4-beta-N-acetylmuramidase)